MTGRHPAVPPPLRPGALDKFEVLIDQREDRDLAEIDLLPPREIEQEVERAFPAVNGEGQRVARFGRHIERGLVPVVRLERREGGFFHHAARASSRSRVAVRSA